MMDTKSPANSFKSPLQNISIKPVEQKPADRDPQDLLDALYWVWDAFDRSNVPFFLVHQTYEDAIKDRSLRGDKVEIGIRKNEWNSGGRRILENFIQPVKESETEALYEFRRVNSNEVPVPVILHIYPDSPCITATNPIMYKYENFSVPNPYSEFIKIYG